MTQLLMIRRPEDPFRCGICSERFTEEWMAKRCQDQGRPHIEYHPQDVVANRSGRLLVCRFFRVHHGIGVKCPVEGPCPHDVTYYGYHLRAATIGVERAWVEVGDFLQLQPGWEKVATLSSDWGVIPESGTPALYLTVDPQRDWEKLWGFYPERFGRRGRKRLI